MQQIKCVSGLLHIFYTSTPKFSCQRMESQKLNYVASELTRIISHQMLNKTWCKNKNTTYPIFSFWISNKCNYYYKNEILYSEGICKLQAPHWTAIQASKTHRMHTYNKE